MRSIPPETSPSPEPVRSRCGAPHPRDAVDAPIRIAAPACLYLEVTNRCNLECRTCIRTYRQLEPPADLARAAVRRILDQMEGGPERAVLQGIGEPLLNPELFEIVADLKAREARVVFNTNATLLDPDRRRRIIESGVDELRISLDAVTASTFERVRGAPPRVFERILAGVRGMAADVRQSGAGAPHLSLWIIGVHENIDDLVPIVRLAREVGIGEVYLHRLVFQDAETAFGIAREESSIFLDVPGGRVDAVIAEAEAVAQRLGIAFRGSGAASPAQLFESRGDEHSRPWEACRRPWTLMYITANGNVLPCCIAPFATPQYGDIVLGNVFSEPLESIWNGERYRRFRRRLRSDDPNPCCRSCGVKWSL